MEIKVYLVQEIGCNYKDKVCLFEGSLKHFF